METASLTSPAAPTTWDASVKFVDSTATFAIEEERILRAEVDGVQRTGVWIKPGSMIAYRGEFDFNRLPTLTGHSLEEMAMRELTPLVKAEGSGTLYCSHHGYHVKLISLAGQTIHVNGSFMLAFEDSLDYEISLAGKWSGLAAGGIFAIRLSGNGALAIVVHGHPLVLPVTADTPVFTDPHATLGWTAGLSPSLETDLKWRMLVKHGNDEAVQFQFAGEGRVAVQPSEEEIRFTGKRILDKLPILRLFRGGGG
jgi:uncharacterized protein (AIM24 family)